VPIDGLEEFLGLGERQVVRQPEHCAIGTFPFGSDMGLEFVAPFQIEDGKYREFSAGLFVPIGLFQARRVELEVGKAFPRRLRD
jgi:hypothetical protein